MNLPMVHASSHIGIDVVLDPSASVGPNCHLLGRITVEAGAMLTGGVTLIGDLIVGRQAVIEPGVCIAAPRPGQGGIETPVHIGAGAHVGAGSVLLAGVKIGDHAWVAPGTVVLRHIPAHAVVSGNPASISGYLDEADQASRVATAAPPRPEGSGVQASLVEGVSVHHFARIRDLRGDLTVGEFERNVPFTPKRYFLVFDVPSTETRGEHAHRICHQFLVCVAGTVSVVVDDGRRREEVLLDRPNIGLLIPAGIWGIQYKYSRNGVLLVFASEYYDASDYIRNYDEYLSFRGVKP